jgi:hypothetical protein
MLHLLSQLKHSSSIHIPGHCSLVRNHWLFPIVVDTPNDTITLLNKYGIDAYQGATQLALVPIPSIQDCNKKSTPSSAISSSSSSLPTSSSSHQYQQVDPSTIPFPVS